MFIMLEKLPFLTVFFERGLKKKVTNVQFLIQTWLELCYDSSSKVVDNSFNALYLVNRLNIKSLI